MIMIASCVVGRRSGEKRVSDTSLLLLFSFINYLCEYVYLRQEIKALVLVLTRMVNSVMVYGTHEHVVASSKTGRYSYFSSYLCVHRTP